MAIEMAGGVYCPLSPRDPQHRLYSLIEQTHSRLVLVHHLTESKFQNDVISININSLLINNTKIDVDIDQLSRIVRASDDISYVIFTSGSTGTPKAVSDIGIYAVVL